MATHSLGYSLMVGDGADPEVFTELCLQEPPEAFGGAIATYANRTTKDTGNTKKYGLGFEDGEEMALMVERDFGDDSQNLLRAAYADRSEINLQHVFTDGTTTETNTAPFLILSQPVTPTDQNGDGETVKQTWNVKRNGDWV